MSTSIEAVSATELPHQLSPRVRQVRRPHRHIRKEPWSAVGGRSSRVLLLTIGAICAIPAVVAGVAVIGSTWSPAGDWAMLELRTLDVVTADAPLLGPYSRFGWNHPGPLLFLVLGVPYHLTGQMSWVLLATAAAVNAVVVVAVVWFAGRRGGLLLAGLTGIVLVALQGALGSPMLRDPWNPWITVLPFALLLIAAWACLEGDRWAPAVLGLTGSFLAQAHIGFAPIVTILTMMAAAGWLLRRQPLRPLLIGAGVLLACSLPILADAAVGERNTLTVLRHFGSDRSADVVGLDTSLGLAATQLSVDGPWSGEEERISSRGGVEPGSLSGLIPPVLAILGAAAVAWRTRNQRALRLQLTVVVTAVAAVVSVSRIDGEAYDYLIRWWWPLAALWWVAVAWPICEVVARAFRDAAVRAGRTIPRAPRAGLAVLGAALLVVLALDDDDTVPAPEWTPVITETSAQVLATLDGDPSTDTISLRSTGPLAGWVKDGLALELTKSGVDVKVFDVGVNAEKFGRHRVLDRPAEGGVVELLVVTGSESDHWLTPQVSVPIAHRPASGSTPSVTVYADLAAPPGPVRLGPDRSSAHAGVLQR